MKNFTKIILLALITTFSFSYEKENSSTYNPMICDVSNPAQDLPWLKALIESWVNSPIYTYMYVKHGTYLGQTVFIVGNCYPLFDPIILFYNCKGESVNIQSVRSVSDQKIIWKPIGSPCT